MEPLQLQQDLTEAGDFQHVFVIKLLFDGRPQRPEMEQLLPALRQALGEVEVVSGSQQLSSFALLAHLVTYKDGQRMPAQVLMADVAPFDAGEIGPFERSQLWDVPDGEALLDGVGYQLMLSDFLASGLDYKERCWILSKWLEIVLKLLPQCQAVWVPASGKLLTRDHLLRNPEQFVYWAVNVRFFHIAGTEDMLVDTLGLYAIGLPDVQYHFRGLDPNAVVMHACHAADYLFAQGAVIESGETIDGLVDGEISPRMQWRCQLESALIQPSREVLDIHAGKYAAGSREPEA